MASCNAGSNLGAHAPNRPAQDQPPAGGDTDMLIARVCLSKPHSLDPLRSTLDLALAKTKHALPKLDNFGTVRMACRILVSRSSRGLQRITVQEPARRVPQACKGCEVVTRHPESRSYAPRMTLAWSRQLFTACSAPPFGRVLAFGRLLRKRLEPKARS